MLLHGRADRDAVGGQPGDELLQLRDRRSIASSRCSSSVDSTVFEVGDDLADDGVAVGERGGQRRGVLQQVGDGAALALQHLDDLVRERVDVLRRQRR